MRIRFGCGLDSRIYGTYLIIPCNRVLLEKLTEPQLVKKFHEFYWTRRFITAFTSARHLSLSWASSIQSTPLHLTSSRSILILSSHLRLGLPSCFFPSGFHTKTLYRSHLSTTSATYPAHLIKHHGGKIEMSDMSSLPTHNPRAARRTSTVRDRYLTLWIYAHLLEWSQSFFSNDVAKILIIFL